MVYRIVLKDEKTAEILAGTVTNREDLARAAFTYYTKLALCFDSTYMSVQDAGSPEMTKRFAEQTLRDCVME